MKIDQARALVILGNSKMGDLQDLTVAERTYAVSLIKSSRHNWSVAGAIEAIADGFSEWDIKHGYAFQGYKRVHEDKLNNHVFQMIKKSSSEKVNHMGYMKYFCQKLGGTELASMGLDTVQEAHDWYYLMATDEAPSEQKRGLTRKELVDLGKRITHGS